MTDVAAAATDTTPRRRVARLRLNRESLSAFVFLLPFLVIFGLFAWFPMLRAAVMSVQQTNFGVDPTFVGLQNFTRVLADPQFGLADPEHGLVRARWPWCSASRCRSSSPCS